MSDQSPLLISVDELTTSLNGLLDNLDELATATCQVNLVKSIKKPTEQNTRYLNMTETLAERFKEDLDTSLRHLITEALSDGSGLAPFGFQAFADGRLAVMPTNHFGEVESWLGKFPSSDVVQPFNGDNNYLSKLRFIHTELTFSEGESVHIFRSSTETKIVRRGLMARILEGSLYKEVESDSVLVFDDIVDFFVWRDYMYISNYRKFESILDFQSVTSSIADTSFATVIELLPVSEPESLKQALFASKRSLNKMAGLGRKTHLPQLDMSRIKTLIQEAGLPIRIDGEGEGAVILVDATDKSQLRAYLHVLDDDYVSSLLTDIRYIGVEKNLM